jgi:hypothetical protein
MGMTLSEVVSLQNKLLSEFQIIMDRMKSIRIEFKRLANLFGICFPANMIMTLHTRNFPNLQLENRKNIFFKHPKR